MAIRMRDFDRVLDAARAGEPWALEVLYRDLAPPVLAYLRGQGAVEPEDLASEVFVGMVRNLRGFRGDEAALRTWVFSIAHRRLVDERRRLSRRHEEAVDPGSFSDHLALAWKGDAEEEALARLGGRWALQALRALTQEQRAVLLLRVLADLSVAEVAEILGKSRGAVKSLQRRALLALARQIEREGVS